MASAALSVWWAAPSPEARNLFTREATWSKVK
jgi:hypothetical protein